MTDRTAATVLLALALLAGASVSSPASAESPLAPTDLTVLVTDLDGDALEGARVLVRTEHEEAVSETDAEGRAVFGGLLGGKAEIVVTLAGYDRRGGSVALSGGAQTHEVALAPDDGEGAVTVLVLDEDGGPIEGARVHGNAWDSASESYDEAVTDADGRATLDLEGRGGVSAEAEGYLGGWGEFDTADGRSLVEIRLREKPRPDATLVGTVLDEDGEPVEGATVVVRRDWRHHEAKAADADGRTAAIEPADPVWCCPEDVVATTDADGRFEAEVYSGGLAVEARAKGYAVTNARTSVEEGGREEIEITLHEIPERDAVVSGVVVDASTGLPVAGAGVSLNNLAWGDHGWASTGADGRFEITTYPGYAQVWIHAGHGEVCILAEAAATDDAEVVEGEAGGAPAPEPTAEPEPDRAEPLVYPSPCTPSEGPRRAYYSHVTHLVLASGSNGLRAELEPKPEPGVVLVGYVVDDAADEAIAGAWVSVRNEDTGEWGNAQTGEDGSYRILVRPGRIVVDANAEGYYPRSETLRVTEDGLVRRDVRLVAGETRWIPWEEREVEERPKATPAYAGGGDAVVAESGGAPQSTSVLAADDDAAAGRGAENEGAPAYSGGPGGLGPYTASDVQPGVNPAPAGALVAALVALGLAGALRRRS